MRDGLPLNTACSLELKALRSRFFSLIIQFIAFFIKTLKKVFILALQKNKSEIQILLILTLISMATVAHLNFYSDNQLCICYHTLCCSKSCIIRCAVTF